MKRILFIFCILIASSSFCFAKSFAQDAFRGKNATIIDYHSEANDFIIIKNKSSSNDVWTLFGNISAVSDNAPSYNFSLDNYLSDMKENDWYQLCKTNTLRKNRKAKFTSRWMSELTYMEKFAVYANSGKDYEYQLETHNDDLYLYIYDKGHYIPGFHIEIPKWIIITFSIIVGFYGIAGIVSLFIM